MCKVFNDLLTIGTRHESIVSNARFFQGSVLQFNIAKHTEGSRILKYLAAVGRTKQKLLTTLVTRNRTRVVTPFIFIEFLFWISDKEFGKGNNSMDLMTV